MAVGLTWVTQTAASSVLSDETCHWLIHFVYQVLFHASTMLENSETMGHKTVLVPGLMELMFLAEEGDLRSGSHTNHHLAFPGTDHLKERQSRV